MKSFIVALALAVAGLALLHPSQAAGAIIGIPGYYDQATQTFVPMVVPLSRSLGRAQSRSPSRSASRQRLEPTSRLVAKYLYFASDGASRTTLPPPVLSFDRALSDRHVPIPYDWTTAATGELADLTVSCSEGDGFSAEALGTLSPSPCPGSWCPPRSAP